MGKKLYRYRAFNTIKGGCFYDELNGRAVLSSPRYFNDPYDCELCFGLDITNSIIDRAMWISLLEDYFFLTYEQKDKILKSDSPVKAVEDIVQESGYKFESDLSSIINNKLKECKDKIRNAIGVLCLSEKNDSMLMWSHYAKNHTGYCIEYVFEENDEYYDKLYCVRYVEDRYVISEEDVQSERKDWLYKAVCYKSNVWEYEREWRIVVANFNMERKNSRGILDLRKNISAFYLGSEVDENYEALIIRYGKENGIAVYKMERVPIAYKLKARRIV